MYTASSVKNTHTSHIYLMLEDVGGAGSRECGLFINYHMGIGISLEMHTGETVSNVCVCVCVCVCVFFPFILDIKFVGRTSRGHTEGRSHRIIHSPSFCGACLNFSREKDAAISFPRRP